LPPPPCTMENTRGFKNLMSQSPLLLSIQVAKPQSYGLPDATDTHDKPWTTGFSKRPLPGRSLFRSRNCRRWAGRSEKPWRPGQGHPCVLCRPLRRLAERLAMPDMPYGAFGENLTITGLTEESVHIGDVFCHRLAYRRSVATAATMLEISAALAAQRTGADGHRQRRTGWYLRVLIPGTMKRACRSPCCAGPIPTGPPHAAIAFCITSGKMWNRPRL